MNLTIKKGACVVPSLVFCVVFCRSLFVLLFKHKLYNLRSREKSLNPIVIIYVEPTVPLLAIGN
jgi:hypothetical protein